MFKHARTMLLGAAMAAAPAVVVAQAATTPPPTQPATCDCPVGDARGNLRDLAAFAPLGLLGALAAAGGAPALFAAQPAGAPVGAPPVVASNDPAPRGEVETPITESGRTPPAAEPPAVSVNNTNVPDPVSPDSLRGGIRAPNTGTPLPSVFLIGSALVAIGCVTIIRARG